MEPDSAPAVSRRDRLTRSERWIVAAAAVAPVLVAVVVLVPIAIVTGATAGEVVVAALAYGGLLGLATGFVAVDRLQARQCPRCTTRNHRRARACEDCGYDLVRRPRYACSERHSVHVEPGLCACGRRLQELRVARGIGPEVGFILRAGAWLLAFLLAVGVALQYLAR